MKSILTFTSAVLLLFFVNVIPALAAPGATVSTDAARRYVFFTFTGLKEVSKVNYTLVYDSNGVTRGFEGLIRTKTFTSRTTKKQILGTCSSGRCVFHKSPKNIQLEVNFTLRRGGSVNVVKTLP